MSVGIFKGRKTSVLMFSVTELLWCICAMFDAFEIPFLPFPIKHKFVCILSIIKSLCYLILIYNINIKPAQKWQKGFSSYGLLIMLISRCHLLPNLVTKSNLAFLRERQSVSKHTSIVTWMNWVENFKQQHVKIIAFLQYFETLKERNEILLI